MVKRRAVVTAATTTVGRHLCATLHREGYWVRALVTDLDAARDADEVGAPALSDIVDELVTGEATAAVSGVDVVLYVAARGEDRVDPELLAASREGGVEEFVFLASLAGSAGKMPSLVATQLKYCGMQHHIYMYSVLFADMLELLRVARTGVTIQVGLGTPRLNPIHEADLADSIVEQLGEGSGFRFIGGEQWFTQARLADLAEAAWGNRHTRRLWLGPRGLAFAGKGARMLAPWRRSIMALYGELGNVDLLGEPVGKQRLGDYFAAYVASRPRIVKS